MYKKILTKAALTGISAVMGLSLVLPVAAFADNDNNKGREKNEKSLLNVSSQWLPPGQIKKVENIIKNAQKKIEKAEDKEEREEQRSNQNTISAQNKAFSASIRVAQEAFQQALKQANVAYQVEVKAAQATFTAAITAAAGNQTAVAAAVAAHRASLLTALQRALTAKQTAIAQFIAALQTIRTNQAPTAQAQSLSVVQNGSLAITLTGNDPENASLTFSVISGPTHGTLSGTGAARTYVPTTNYTGADSFTFKVNDGTLDSAVATVSITVTPIANQAPTANAQSLTVAEDNSLAITLTGSDPQNSALSFAVVAGPTHGTLAGTAGTRTYTPAVNYNGADSFTFKVNDGTLDSAVATVSITVTPVNDAPVANTLSATTTLNVALAATLTGSDVDGCSGQTFTYTVTGQPANGAVAPTSGSATCANGVLTAGVTHTPTLGFTGTNSFNFKFDDGTLGSATGTMTVAVNP